MALLPNMRLPGQLPLHPHRRRRPQRRQPHHQPPRPDPLSPHRRRRPNPPLLNRSLTRKTFAAKTPVLLRSQESVILSEVSRSKRSAAERPRSSPPRRYRQPLHNQHPHRLDPHDTLALLTAVIAFLLTPLSTPIWHHLPNLAYLQFPWRLLTLLTPILALIHRPPPRPPHTPGCPIRTRFCGRVGCESSREHASPQPSPSSSR